MQGDVGLEALVESQQAAGQALEAGGDPGQGKLGPQGRGPGRDLLGPLGQDLGCAALDQGARRRGQSQGQSGGPTRSQALLDACRQAGCDLGDLAGRHHQGG